MDNLELDYDEGIILQTTEVEWYGLREITIDEFILTNKNIVCIYEESNGRFSKSEKKIQRIPLESIKVINGKVQIMKIVHPDYGDVIQFLLKNNHREFFTLHDQKEEAMWINTINATITGDETPLIIEKQKKKIGFFPASKKTVTDNGEQALSKKIAAELAKTENKEVSSALYSSDVQNVAKTERQRGVASKQRTNDVDDVFFCTRCGHKLTQGAKFCSECGIPLQKENNRKQAEEFCREEQCQQFTYSERKQEYAGEIIKCPNCGEVLKSFVSNCPSCGFELRGAKAASAVREFSLKLEAIEARREYEKPVGMFAQADAKQRISKTDEQKISLIKNFVVPNTKEDILEFMILATSNMDTSVYGSTDAPAASTKAIANAWETKIRQVYEKAKNSYGNDEDFQQIERLYDNYTIDLNKQKKRRSIKLFFKIIWVPLLWILIIAFVYIDTPRKNASEETRLEAIVVDSDTALEQKDYRQALRIAESIEYEGYDKERKRWWDIKKESLIDEIIDVAKENGVHIERSPIIPNENKDGIKENIDEFNRIMKEGKNTDS